MQTCYYIRTVEPNGYVFSVPANPVNGSPVIMSPKGAPNQLQLWGVNQGTGVIALTSSNNLVLSVNNNALVVTTLQNFNPSLSQQWQIGEKAATKLFSQSDKMFATYSGTGSQVTLATEDTVKILTQQFILVRLIGWEKRWGHRGLVLCIGNVQHV